MRRTLRALTATILAPIGVVALSLSLVAPAVAKEGGIARFDTPVPMHAQPGTDIELGWTVTVDDNGSPSPVFGSPVFVRLVSASGEAVEASGMERPAQSGHYIATIRVPARGIATVEVGLIGTGCDAHGCHRSDWMFTVSEEPSGFAASVTAASASPAAGVGALAPEEAQTAVDVPAGAGVRSASGSPLDARVPIAIGIGLLGLVGMLAIRTVRRHGGRAVQRPNA